MEAWTARRLAWSVGITSIALIVAALAFAFADRDVTFPAGTRTWSLANALIVAVDIGVPVIGILIASGRRDNAIGWLFLAAGLALGVGHFAQLYALHALRADPGSWPAGRPLAWVANWIWAIPISLLPPLFLLFPTGRLRSTRWRPIAWLSGAVLVVLTTAAVILATASWSHPFRELGEDATGSAVTVGVVLFWAAVIAFPVALLLSFAAVALRFAGSTGEERLQLKWFVTAAALVAVAFSVDFFVEAPIVDLLTNTSLVLLYTTVGIAVLKHRLYDIDVIINKAVVYGGLAALISAVYVVVVVVIGAFIGATEGLALVATAIVAVVAQPARERAQRVANRLVYGKRATPYEVLSEFSEHIGETFAGDEILPRMARLLAEGTGASAAVVWLRVDSSLRPAAWWPPDVEPGGPMPLDAGELPAFAAVNAAVPVRHQGELLGALTLTKPANDALTRVEEKLVADLAAQAGLVLRNFGLIEDLRASRQRLVAAQDEERRRLERDLHDGAQQRLVALAVRLRLARSLAQRDPGKADDMLEQLERETAEALGELRDLARGIYPPLLADQGLPAALQAQAQKAATPVMVVVGGVTRYPREVEAAIYFCVLEALQNVSKYADASGVTVRLTDESGGLGFSVADDGRGFDPELTDRGAGLQNMADRCAALGGTLDVRARRGGGTTVSGRIPIGSAAPADDRAPDPVAR